MILKIKKFFSEVHLEFQKITWPSWTETKITTILVLVVALIMSVYFLIVDQLIYRFLSMFLGT